MTVDSRLTEIEEALRLLRNANRLQGRRMSAEAPNDNDLVGWNADDKKWEPKSDAPAARAYNSSAITITNNSATVITTLDSERYDTDTIHSTSSNTGRLTATTAGKYIIQAQLIWDNADTDGRRILQIYLNGTTVIAEHETVANAAGTATQEITTIYNLAATDYVEMRVFQDSGSSLDIRATSNTSPEFMMVRLGPTGSSGGGGVSDHGSLTGLGDTADHDWAILKDGSRDFTGEQSMGTNKLTNVVDPGSDQDAATKKYVDDNAVGDVTSSATITDHALVRGDGGAKGVQESLVICDDNGNITGVLTINLTGDSALEALFQGTLVTDTFTDYSRVRLRKARAGPAAVESGDILGALEFLGYGSSAYQEAASILARATETYTTGAKHGSELSFYTSPDNGGGALERWIIGQDGHLSGQDLYKITGLAAGSASGEAVEFDQLHTKYTDSEAITAVPFIEYIPFGSEPITGQSYAP